MRTGLAEQLRRLDGASYGRYKSLGGAWRMAGFTLEVVRGQADPYAPPARLALRVPAEHAGFPEELRNTAARRRGLAGYLARQAAAVAGSGPVHIDRGGQEVLDRSSCRIGDGSGDEAGAVTVRLGVELPGRGRRIDGRAAEEILCRVLPRVVERTLRYASLDAAEVRRFVDTVEDADALRRSLEPRGLVAFVADGAVLPRRSGVDDRPLTGPGVVPFLSPDAFRVEVELPNAGRVEGMGVPEGVTLIVGGGFHGKSTLLRAVEAGVFDHVPGDGRELVVSRDDTVKIRAEDGRRVARVDVHAFVSHLPSGADTADFSTDNASGSTSQAASLVEAVEAGAGTLLIDEDTAATNLMIRDARMQALVAKDREPLTPFVDLVRSLHRDHGVSTVLVMGGSGDYMDVADQVIMMDAYQASDVTEKARELARVPTGRHAEADVFPPVTHRTPDPASVDSRARGRSRVRARGTDALAFGEEHLDVTAVEQMPDRGYVTGTGFAMELLVRRGHLDGGRTLAEALDLLDRELASGAGELLTVHEDDCAVPRRHEVAAALNRLRSLRIKR
ncbi:ABC-ATPase domain-containing protein [Streptomyces sp. NPDC051776]|uniref:ABC-ATPase domain-containing protein n=1 Tax=Streptomyces sp. NPDC051776 TaxID=3155414 RepID=UPI00341ECCDC